MLFAFGKLSLKMSVFLPVNGIFDDVR